MSGRRAGVLLAFAVLGTQAGHLLAYQIRFAGAAQQLQSSGVHSYFPALGKTLAGAAAAVLLGCLLVIGLARVLGRRRIGAAPSLLRLVAVLFTLQLAFFVGQELLEASLAGAGRSGFDLLLVWGTIGQLPAAAVGAAAARWLFARVAPAVSELRALVATGVPGGAAATAPVEPGGSLREPVFATGMGRLPLTRRGPPRSPLHHAQP